MENTPVQPNAKQPAKAWKSMLRIAGPMAPKPSPAPMPRPKLQPNSPMQAISIAPAESKSHFTQVPWRHGKVKTPEMSGQRGGGGSGGNRPCSSSISLNRPANHTCGRWEAGDCGSSAVPPVVSYRLSISSVGSGLGRLRGATAP